MSHSFSRPVNQIADIEAAAQETEQRLALLAPQFKVGFTRFLDAWKLERVADGWTLDGKPLAQCTARQLASAGLNIDRL